MADVLKEFAKIHKMIKGQLSAKLGRNNYKNHRYSKGFINSGELISSNSR